MICKTNVGGFRYKPRRDCCCFGKLRKLCFLCSCKQTRENSIYQRRVRDAYIWIHIDEALIHPRFTMDACTSFDVLWTVEQKHPPTGILKLGRARIFFNITLIGFI